MPWLPPLLLALLVALASGLSAQAQTVDTTQAPLIDGTPVGVEGGEGPVAAVGALLATAHDGVAHEGAVMCSAVLISPRVALTAAHCVALIEADAADEGWQLDWWLSFATDVRGVEGPDPQLPPLTITVEATAVHPGFAADGPPRSDQLDAANDIAVLLLAEPAPVAAVPLAEPQHQLIGDLDEPAPVLVAGYGWTTDDPDAGQIGLRAAGPSLLFEVGAYELRVGRRLEADAPVPMGLAEKCGGDSGGPTFLRTADGWRVLGLTSRGHASDPGCAIAGIDTRADVFAPWIEAVVTGHAAAPADGCMVALGQPTPHEGPSLSLLAMLLARVAPRAGRRRGKSAS